MSLIKLFTESGRVKLHQQGTLSDKRYSELKSAQKMIKRYMGDTTSRVDIYDALTAPKDKFVYTKQPDSVFIEVTDLLDNSTKTEEFMDKADGEPVLRQIFQFIEKIENPFGESPIEKMERVTKIRIARYLKRQKSNIQQ